MDDIRFALINCAGASNLRRAFPTVAKTKCHWRDNDRGTSMNSFHQFVTLDNEKGRAFLRRQCQRLLLWVCAHWKTDVLSGVRLQFMALEGHFLLEGIFGRGKDKLRWGRGRRVAMAVVMVRGGHDSR